MAVNQLIRAACECPYESPRFAFIAPYLKQAKDIAWDYMHKFAGVVPGVEFNESELRVDLPGDRRVRLYGADNPEAIQGIYLDGVVMDEYQLTAPWIFRRIVRPMLADRAGWAIFLGKPFGKNHFYDAFRKLAATPNAIARLYRASETGVVPPDELQLLREDLTEDEYAQEVECSWEAAIPGAYYARQLDHARAHGRIKPLIYEAQWPVHTAWDLGWSDTTAIVFYQLLGREIHVIDYAEASQRDLTSWVADLQHRPYVYGTHSLPHDAEAEQLGAGGRSMRRQLADLGLRNLQVLPRTENVLHDIQQVRAAFGRCWFDSVKCDGLIQALGAYREKFDEKRKSFTGDPEHDWSSHGADAFRYLVMSNRTSSSGQTRAPLHVKQTYNILDHGRERRPFVRSS